MAEGIDYEACLHTVGRQEDGIAVHEMRDDTGICDIARDRVEADPGVCFMCYSRGDVNLERRLLTQKSS